MMTVTRRWMSRGSLSNCSRASRVMRTMRRPSYEGLVFKANARSLVLALLRRQRPPLDIPVHHLRALGLEEDAALFERDLFLGIVRVRAGDVVDAHVSLAVDDVDGAVAAELDFDRVPAVVLVHRV